MAEARERTFIMIKPDGVHRGLVGKIIKRFEAKGFKLVAMKFMWVSNIRVQCVPISQDKMPDTRNTFCDTYEFFLDPCES